VGTETQAKAPFDRWCPACQSHVGRFKQGPNGRPDAACPNCRSLERHRFLALLLEGLSPLIATAGLVVDVAPSPQITKILRRIAPGRCVRIDFDPAADARPVDVQASLTALPFADGSVDLLVCYHVLEHIAPDGAAMAEIARTLKDGGIGIIQVPWRPGRVTDEDPSAAQAERIRRFGQADHVRMYGGDFDERLTKAGLESYRLSPKQVVGDHLVQLFRLVPDETVWLVRRDGGRASDVLDDKAIRFRTLQALGKSSLSAQTRIHNAEKRAAQADARAARWENAYHRLRNRRAVRAMVAMTSPIRRLRSHR
jgi:SAM-dependent methyltransferase